MKKIRKVITHCSDSPFGCVRVIREWHLQKGWSDIGYHFVIMNGRPTSMFYLPSLDGSIECGRYLDEDAYIAGREQGAHALGHNADSIGICLIGKPIKEGKAHQPGIFTDKQHEALLKLNIDIMRQYGLNSEDFIGHYETPKAGGKTCPNLDMPAYRSILEYEKHRRSI